MGGAPDPVTCCMIRFKKQNKQIFITLANGYMYLVTHRQIRFNKLHDLYTRFSIPCRSFIVGDLIRNQKLGNKVSYCQLLDG